MYDVIIVGAGFAGSVMAERFASIDKKVLVIDSRNHIAGNMYDYKDKNGVLVHEYGPHLFHTNIQEVYDYLCNFTEFFKYEHRVLGVVNEKTVPIPFNIDSINLSFSEDKANELVNELVHEYGMEKKVPILELRKSSNTSVNELADYIFEYVFKYYTMKQWGQTVEELDPSVSARVPVYVSHDDRYFQDTYQYMPRNGYTELFKNMLSNKNITVRLNQNCKEVLVFKDGKIYFEGIEFDGKCIYTGALDELFNYELGLLPYRSLEFKFDRLPGTFQGCGTVNYPTPASVNAFTRITEYKHMMETQPEDTTIVYEYPMQYELNKGMIPYYPINNSESSELYNKYLDIANEYSNLYLVGRLANYKYFNMDLVIKEALDLFNEIK